MTIEPTDTSHYFHELALSKLARVVGEENAKRLLQDFLMERGTVEIADAQDLFAFSIHLKSRQGFESTVGAMLSLQAVMRGASAP